MDSKEALEKQKKNQIQSNKNNYNFRTTIWWKSAYQQRWILYHILIVRLGGNFDSERMQFQKCNDYTVLVKVCLSCISMK